MNDIYQRQQEDHFVRMIAAARQFYAEEKRWNLIWTVVSLIVAVLGTGAIALHRQFNAIVVLAAMMVAGAEMLLLPFIHKRREMAARIQEVYDHELLELPDDATIPDPPSPEIINAEAQRYLSRASEEELQGVRLWYTQIVQDKPLSVARFICQKENLWWHGELRTTYAHLIWAAVVVITLLLIVVGIYAPWTLAAFLTGPFLLFFPVLAAGWRNGQSHRRAAARLEELNAIADDFLQAAKKGELDEVTLMWRARQLQTALYHQRVADAPVLEWIYRLAKKRMERLANTPGQFGED